MFFCTSSYLSLRSCLLALKCPFCIPLAMLHFFLLFSVVIAQLIFLICRYLLQQIRQSTLLWSRSFTLLYDRKPGILNKYYRPDLLKNQTIMHSLHQKFNAIFIRIQLPYTFTINEQLVWGHFNCIRHILLS